MGGRSRSLAITVVISVSIPRDCSTMNKPRKASRIMLKIVLVTKIPLARKFVTDHLRLIRVIREEIGG